MTPVYKLIIESTDIVDSACEYWCGSNASTFDFCSPCVDYRDYPISHRAHHDSSQTSHTCAPKQNYLLYVHVLAQAHQTVRQL